LLLTCPCCVLLLFLCSSAASMQSVEALAWVIKCLEAIVRLPLVLDAVALAALVVVSFGSFVGRLHCVRRAVIGGRVVGRLKPSFAVQQLSLCTSAAATGTGHSPDVTHSTEGRQM
jgi:hypothetical protein